MAPSTDIPSRQKRHKPPNPNRCRPKSRGGCQRCKQRRRRCDETKPSCQECVRKGLTCPGYQKKPLEWRYVFQDGEPEDDQGVSPDTLDTSPECVPATLAVTEQADGSKDLQSLWNAASSTIFDQIPDINDSVVARSAERELGGWTNPRSQTDDSLAILHRRLSSTAVPSFLIHMPAVLVQYYFDFVCKSWSSFDCPLNPFRMIVSRLWSRNAAIYYAIQSMAAASLANDFPGMRIIGIQTQQQAIACLRKNPRISSLHRDTQDDDFFLALLMIGLTTSWHDASDLGLGYLKEAKDHLAEQQMSQTPDSTFAKQYPFFQQCLLYWNVLAAFVAEDSLLLNEENVLERPDSETSVYLVDGQTLPHPWTGPLSKSLGLFYRAARLVRNVQISHRTRLDLGSPDVTSLDFDTLMEELDMRQSAENLEEDILFTGFSSYYGPVDIGDTDTPPAHFITLAEAYRCTALLQIYHVFPDLLDERLRLNQIPDQESPALFSLLFEANSSCPSVEEARRMLAIHVVSLLAQISSTSGTRCMHPILIACISSDLVFSSESLMGPAANAVACLNTLDVEIAQARRKVTMWLSELTLILPKLRLQRIREIVQATWDKADSGVPQYWLDIMVERNLETIMG